MALAVPGGMSGGTNSIVKVGGVLLSFMAAQQLQNDIAAHEVYVTDETQHASPEEASASAGETTDITEIELPSYVTTILKKMATDGWSSMATEGLTKQLMVQLTVGAATLLAKQLAQALCQKRQVATVVEEAKVVEVTKNIKVVHSKRT